MNQQGTEALSGKGSNVRALGGKGANMLTEYARARATLARYGLCDGDVLH